MTDGPGSAELGAESPDLSAESAQPGDESAEPALGPDVADDEVEVAAEEVAVELDDGGAELESDDPVGAVGTAPIAVPATQLRLPPEPTGDARVDGALERLGDLEDLPTSEHVAVFEDVHRRLQSALADLGPDA